MRKCTRGQLRRSLNRTQPFHKKGLRTGDFTRAALSIKKNLVVGQNKLTYLSINQELHSIAEGKEAMRHKKKNIYYLGEWDAKGYPKGRGIQYKID